MNPRLLHQLITLSLLVSPLLQANAEYIYLDQGWTYEERETFWSLGQGSEIMPYAWILHLEQATNQSLFIDPANIRKLGYVPWPTTSKDSDSENQPLPPIGFTQARNPHTGENWLGMNCSACHTNLISYKNKTMLIDGAPSMGDYWTFNIQVTEALWATFNDDEKFTRFARNLKVAEADENELRNRLMEIWQDRHAYNERNKHEIVYGHGRLDALGFIYNEVVAGRLSRKGDPPNSGIEENISPPESPVSYPFLWGTAQADYLQWNGVSYAQMPIGNLARDVVEVLGVYGRVEIDCDKGTFKSSILFRNSLELGDMVATLKAPHWPNNILPPVNAKAAEAGKKIYRQYCQNCHEVIPRKLWDKHYQSSLWPMEIIGTDAKYGAHATAWKESGCLEGQTIMHFIGPALEPYATYYSIVSHVALGAMLEEFGEAILPTLSLKGMWTNLEQNGLVLREPTPVYKARPLNGIWATAPYLHNGSVANLRELLSPPDERSETIVVGCSNFDPVDVGFDCRGYDSTTTLKVKGSDCVYDYSDDGAEIDHLSDEHRGELNTRDHYQKFPFRNGRVRVAKEQIKDSGDCNFGHDIRKQNHQPFSDIEKTQLVEFLKTL